MNGKFKKPNPKDKTFNTKSIKDEPDHYEDILKLGLIDVKENNFPSAKEKFKKLLKIDKTKYEGYVNLANIYSEQNNYKDAIIHYKAALKASPRNFSTP